MRKILSVLLVLAMVLSMVPVTAVTAAGAVTASPKAGTHTAAGHADDCGHTDGWLPWPSDNTIPTNGHYYLTGNVNLTGMISLSKGESLHICLNGYVMTAASGKRAMSAAEADTEIVITDCTAYTDDSGVYRAGAITGGKATGSSGGGMAYVYADSVLKLYDGIITGNTHKNDSKGGGAISLRKKDGEYTKGGSFYMFGGEISDNHCYKTDGSKGAHGGAIYAEKDAVVEITGGTIKNNSAGSGGGAICVKNAALTVQNATITGNTGTNGGAIYFDGSSQVLLKDCVITGNTGTSTNTTYGYSAAVLNAGTATKLTLSGKVIIADNTMHGSVPDLSFTKADTDTVYIHNLTEGSRVVFATPVTAATKANEILALGTAQTESWQSGWVKWLSAIDGTGTLKDVGLVNGEFVFGHYHGEQEYTALENADQLLPGGHFYLASDVKLDKQGKVDDKNSTFDLCLNGHSLTPADGQQTLYIAGTRNIVATIDDCTAYTDDSGVYHAGAITGADNTSNGGAIYVGSTNTLNLKNGRITGNKGGSGGAIITYGTVNMSGGEISNNQAGSATASKSGGGIYVNNTNGKFFMTGGKIFGNSATSDGGGVYVGKNAQVLLQNAEITGNTAGETGGGICLADGVDATLRGKVEITGNTVAGKAENLHLVGTTMLKPDDLSGAIGVTLAAKRITAGTMQITGEITSDPGCFTSDDSDYKVELVSNKLTLVEDNTTPPAPPAAHKHNGCNDASCADGHAQIEYQEWTNPKALPSEGNWYLGTDVVVEDTVEYAAGANKTLNLCLNGKTVTQKAGTNAQMYNTTKAGAGVTITIADCTAKTENGVYTAGKVTGFEMSTANGSATEGSVLYLRSGSTLEIFDGIFTNNKTVGKSAGALMIDGTFRMHGGEFSNNSANNGQSNAGAIYINKNADAIIAGGTFKNNTGKDGGAIYAMNGTFKNVVFEGNTATGQGGALLLRSSSSATDTAEVTLENVTITGNVSGVGGAVYVLESLKSLTLKGNTVIDNNTLDGKAANLYLMGKEIITLDGFTGKAGVGAEKPGRAITGDCADLSSKFSSDSADYMVKYQDGKLHLVAAFEHNHCICGKAGCTEHEMVAFQPWNDADSLPDSGNYCLLTDVTLTKEYAVKGDLNLCLNGHDITTSIKKRLIGLPNDDVTLTITDCTAKTENGVYTAGKLTGGVDASKVGGGAIFVRAGATLKLYEGIITDNKTLCDGAGGGAILLQSTKNDMIASFYMYGGEISGNKACSADGTPDRTGGGIYAYRKSVVVMEGGVIKNNEAGTGGGIHAYEANLTIGGQVIDNKADTGAGINVDGGTTVMLTGAPVITGNTSGSKANNLNLVSSPKFSVGTLDSGAKVAVSAPALSFISEPCADVAASFMPDNSKYQVVYKDGALYMDAAGNHKHCLCAATSTYCDHEARTFVEWDDPKSLPSSGSYYLSVDVEIEKQATLTGTELNLCLNGHTVKIVGESARAFYTKGNAVLRITDCAEKAGVITGGTKAAIVTENVTESKALVELWNGILTGNENTSLGGAIQIQGGTTLNMYGGKITGNKLPCKLAVDADGNVILNADGSQDITSDRGGGGVGLYGNDTVFHLYGGEITDNETTMVEYLNKKGEKTSGGGFGGGIYVYRGELYIHGGKISGNTTDRTAGGIFTMGDALVEITGGEISGNTCKGNGGGLYVSNNGVMTISGGEISNNYAEGGAGAFRANTGAKVTMTGGKITKNQSKSSCGGVMINGKNTEMTMTGGEISNNSSEGSAGGLLAQSGGTFNLKGGKITGNYCKGTAAGVYISKNSFFNMTGGSINNNHAKGSAGGLYLATKAVGKISGGSVSYNISDGAAGGFRMVAATVTASGLSVIGNTAKDGSGSGLWVGGTTVTENGVKKKIGTTVSLYGCTISGNVAEDGSAGGALFQTEGTVVNAQNCTFTNNKATGSGGGMYVSTKVKATFKNCKFIGNEAAAGGGFRLNNCTATMDNIVVAENKGQGAYVYGANNQSTLSNFEIYKNEHSSAAGIQFNTGCTATFTDSRVYSNTAAKTAGGVYIGNNSNVTMKNIDIFENTATNGGAFYAGAGSRATGENVQIHENSASELGGGMYTGGAVTFTNCSITDNKSGGSGGGIHTWKVGSRITADDGCLRLVGCDVSGNTAGGQGGGVYVFRGGPAALTDTTVTDNKANQEGGGIYCDGKLDLTNVTVTGNHSGGTGYALYIGPSNWDGHSYTAGHRSISGDMIVQNNEGGDMYMDTASSVAVNGATLGDKAVVNVTLCDGVLTQRVIGVYHYEGSDLNYTLTAGDRSITEPMAPEGGAEPADEQTAGKNAVLYVGIGVFAAAVAAVAVLLVLKKAGKPAEEATKE